MVNCAIIGCKSRSERKDSNITFHRFPREELYRNKWIECTGRVNWQPSKHSRVCSKHFESCCFQPSKNDTYKYLKLRSVPTIFIQVGDTFMSYLSSSLPMEVPMETETKGTLVQMNKVEVDPKLFITCRLCLDEMGVYQIVPHVQKQIKFCFEIEVNPFDGLPQLICKKCESILSQFYDAKTTFQEKQNALICNTAANDVNSIIPQQQNTVTSTQQPDIETTSNTQNFLKIKLKRGENLPLNITGSHSDSGEINKYSIVRNDESKNKTKKISKVWRKNYDRYFMCRFCSTSYKDKKSLLVHTEKHKEILIKYSNMLTHCSVNVLKHDKKPNITGQTDTVVFHHDRIIQNKSEQYYILYEHKNRDTTLKKINYLSDSSNDIGVNNRRKRIRLLSRSSSETVIIEDKKKQCPASTSVSSEFFKNVFEAVDINESPESESQVNIPNSKRYLSQTQSNCAVNNIISQIVSSCQNKYKRCDHFGKNVKIDLLLQRKILSIGRKLVCNKGFNCTGLLRYMEHKNLDVHWLPRFCRSKDTENYVRIRTKLREKTKSDNNSLWSDFSELTCKEFLEKMQSSHESCGALFEETSIQTCADAALDTICTKLLNSTPVANPKQLPKKSILIEPTATVSQASQIETFRDDLFDSNTDEPISMPVITTTVSLAQRTSISTNNDNENDPLPEDTATDTNKVSTFVPRIKVKPVSQLMPERSEKNPNDHRSTNFMAINDWQLQKEGIQISSQNNIHYNTSNSLTPHSSNVCFRVDDNNILNVNQNQNKIVSSNHSKNQEYVLMHTVELPNYQTNSPFQYFRTLLKIHGISLITSFEMTDDNMICLVKFRSLFTQEKKSRITLSLALVSDTKRFCMKIKDMTKDIDIESLSPHWQWEILQLYKSDIVDKLLDNANKISVEMLKASNRFICLLKSITFKKL